MNKQLVYSITTWPGMKRTPLSSKWATKHQISNCAIISCSSVSW